MPRLYRSPREPHHWLVWSADFGWRLFPAKNDGWREWRPVASVERQELQRIPLRLAFNTGLLESLEARTLARAA